jgi:hypothetical protein
VTPVNNTLSINQLRFVKDAYRAGLQVNFNYSGRGMFGGTCPAVVVEDITDFSTIANVRTDNMGHDYVVYARF